MKLLGIVFLFLFLLVVALVFLHRRSMQHMVRIEAFTERAIEKFLETENPISLQYILIADSVLQGPQAIRVLGPLERAKKQVEKLGDPTRLDRVRKIRRELDKQLLAHHMEGTSFQRSLDLKKRLNSEQFLAWRKLDPSIFDRL